MIRVYQHPEENTRSANNGCSWVAEAIVNGISYSARSRHGAPHELARVLVAAGLPDAPMRVATAGLLGETTYRSFHAAAGRTIEENAKVAIRSRRYRPPQDDTQGVRAAPKQGVNDTLGIVPFLHDRRLPE
jgi:hypothetical protein